MQMRWWQPALVLMAGGAAATGLYPGDQSLEYLLRRTSSSRPLEADPGVDCMWREMALKYADKLQPWLNDAQRGHVYDALELKGLCGQAYAPRADTAAAPVAARRSSDAVEVYVAPGGSDSNSGSMAAPFASVERAVRATRGRAAGTSATVYLRAGTYFLADTIQLGSADSGLRVAAYNGEAAEVSGGRHVGGLDWQPVAGRDGVYSCSLANHSENLPRGVPALRHRNARVTLARYPNANPELDLFPKGYITETTTWGPPEYNGAVCNPNMQCGKSVNLTIPATDAWHGMYQNFTEGIGGACDRYDPPRSPWCSGDFYLLRQFPEMHTRSPASVTPGSLLPNGPYRRPKGSTVHAWRPGHWYTWMFEVGQQTASVNYTHWTVKQNTNAVWGMVPSPKQNTTDVAFLGEFGSADECWAACNNTAKCSAFAYHTASFSDPSWRQQCYGVLKVVNRAAKEEVGVVSGLGPHVEGGELLFSGGGNQGGEGDDFAKEWFVEGVEEELDAVNEFWYDGEAKRLYFKPNSTSAPDSEVVVPTLSVFFDVAATMQAPASDITFDGISVVDGRPTFMEPHGNPSGGDWALERQGAIRIEGAREVRVQNCLFTRLDSNAVSINGYARNVTVDKNEFVWLGQNCVASWGRAKDNDGTDGEFPRFNTVTRNLVHEIGHIQKQSSFYFQAETAEAVIEGNLVYNIPRAGINFNDGFGGGALITQNLLFNTCRESGDHGAFNSWDRLPYLTTVGSATPSTVPKRNDVNTNFIVANYAADGGCLDNDDGSAYYDIHHNFCMFGGHKANFDGHSKSGFNNVYVHPQVYGTKCVDEEGEGLSTGTSGPYGLPPRGYAEQYTDNICILPSAGTPYLVVAGDLHHPKEFGQGLVLRNNTVYVPGGDHPDMVSVSQQQSSFSNFQKLGFDETSRVVAGAPSTAQIAAWGSGLLGL
eukprot:TRINITY_DN1513_c0_g1_i3.p1 TRINITY_DN1513_c0_g1~~TRINITY_DN1513_c0_g1_i3.p1  ORF type:complete len:935 (+),score=335.66 TRINITY_DN1513_c0_g1_i3:85-2889(+)